MHRAALAALSVLAILAGCDWAHDLGGKVDPDSLSLADRCANIARMAMPSADIDFTSRTSENQGIDIIVARVAGTRTNLPAGVKEGRDLAAECRFDDTVLSGFQWTKGGPPPHGGPPQ